MLLADAPGIVGNLEGVPYTVRDAANRAVLEADLTAIRGTLAGSTGRGQSQFLAERLRTLEQVRTRAASAHRAAPLDR